MDFIKKAFISSLLALSISTSVKAESGATYIPDEVKEVVDKYAEEYFVSPYIIYALIEKESSGNVDAVSASGTCKGLMQINPKVHASRMEGLGYTTDQVFEIEANVHTGIDYLMDINFCSGIDDLAYCLDVYNGNSKAMYNFDNGIVTPYAKKIINRAMELTWYYEMETQGKRDL